MEGLLLIGLIIAGVVLSLFAAPSERVIYIIQPAQPPAPAQEQGSGGVGFLLLLLVGALLVLAVVPAV